MSTQLTPQQPPASSPSPASPAATPPTMQGVPAQVSPPPASVPSSTAIPVGHPCTRDNPQPLLTAQLSSNLPPLVGDKSAIDPLTGGAVPPSPPPKPKQNRRKRRGNKIGFRIDDDLLERITAHRALSGMNETDTIRQLLSAGLGMPVVLIAPKSPPEQLESFLGKMLDWERSLHGIKSRLNAPLPRDDRDAALIELVRQWRAESKALLEQIPSLVESAQAVARALSSLSPAKIQKLRDCYPAIKDWQLVRQKKIDDPGLAKEKAINERWRDRYQVIIELIDDLGILPQEEK